VADPRLEVGLGHEVNACAQQVLGGLLEAAEPQQPDVRRKLDE